jgi:hypothetical protein
MADKPIPQPPNETIAVPNGKKLGWRIANAAWDGWATNWGKIISFGLGTVIAIWLMQLVIIPMNLMVMDSYKENDKVNRSTALDNSESLKSVAASMAVQAGESVKQTDRINTMVAITKEVSLSQTTIKDMSKAGQEAAKAAQEAAAVAGRGMSDQKPILEAIEKSSAERTKIQREVLAETKQFVPSLQKMEAEASADRKMYWSAAEKRDATMLQNQRVIIERLIPVPKPPGK